MKYAGFSTFTTEQHDGILTVTSLDYSFKLSLYACRRSAWALRRLFARAPPTADLLEGVPSALEAKNEKTAFVRLDALLKSKVRLTQVDYRQAELQSLCENSEPATASNKELQAKLKECLLPPQASVK